VNYFNKGEDMKKKAFLVLLLVGICAITFSGVINDEFITVEAEGIGTNIDEALTNAMREAITTAVGAIFRAYSQMDSSFQSIGNEITEELSFKEKILTFTKAYIKDYEVIEKSQDETIITIKIKALIKLQALEGSILRNAEGFSCFDGEKLLRIYEANTTTETNTQEIVYAVLKDFGVPRDLWTVEEIETKIISSNENNVTIKVDSCLTPDMEKYLGFLKQLEEILDMACAKKMTETLYAETDDEWDKILLSDFIRDSKFRSVIRLFKEKKGNTYTFKQYFLNTSNEMEEYVFEAFEDYCDDFDSYSLEMTLLNVKEEEIFKLTDIRITASSLILKNATLGLAFTSQTARQYILLPGTMRIVPGKLNLSQQNIRFSFEVEVPRQTFMEAKKVKINLTNLK